MFEFNFSPDESLRTARERERMKLEAVSEIIDMLLDSALEAAASDTARTELLITRKSKWLVDKIQKTLLPIAMPSKDEVACTELSEVRSLALKWLDAAESTMNTLLEDPRVAQLVTRNS